MGSATTSDRRTARPAADHPETVGKAITGTVMPTPWRGYYDPDSAAYDEFGFGEEEPSLTVSELVESTRAMEAVAV